VNHGCRDATALELYGIVARGVGKGLVCLERWRWVGWLCFYWCVGGCWTGVRWYTYLRWEGELDQAQHTSGNVRSRSTR
jgi:hypothetical protein